MRDKTAIWNQIIEDSKKFGYYERLTPHIYSLSKATNKCLSNLRAATVLDVGAGDKKYRDNINCTEYISIDISGDVDTLADATILPFKDNSFDMLICTQVLEHVKDPFSAVEEFSRILKEQGVIFITVPTAMYLHEVPNDYFRYTKYGIEFILKRNNISVQDSKIICSGFLVGLELFFIGIYLQIYNLIRICSIRRLLVNSFSCLSLVTLRLDLPFFRSVFPGNIMITAYKTKRES